MKVRTYALGAAAILLACLLYWALRVCTPDIADRPGTSDRAIASLEEVTLGGDKQWVLIRGRDRRAPIVLFLHGGPGMPMMYLAYAFQRPLEDRFLVVQWDRRGAGKSYSAGTNHPEKMRVSQEITDTVSLIEQLRARFGLQKIILVGHSYGTSLGVRVAQARPDLLRAYVAVGQEACDRKTELKIQDDWIAAAARRHGDADALKLATSGKRYDRESLLFRYGGEIEKSTSFFDLLWIGLRAPEYSLLDAWHVKAGVDFTHARMRDDVSKGGLMNDVRHLSVPVYLFEGRQDYTSPASCAIKFFDDLSAPKKQLIWFEHSAHFPFLEEPQAFASGLERVARETAGAR
jgi:pimeloyl-ACP methyl ester carboxylesterase